MQNEDNRTIFQRAFDYIHEHIIAVIIIVAIIAGISCTAMILNGNQNQQDMEKEITEYKAMKNVYFAMDKVSSLNPLSSNAEDTYYISKLVFSSLFKMDEHLNIEKDLWNMVLLSSFCIFHQ